VSRQLKLLEEELGGLALFRRDPHKVTLTAEGAEFLPYAQRILREHHDAVEYMQKIAAGQMGLIRIIGVPSCTGEITDCVAAFSKKYREIMIRATILEGRDLNAALCVSEPDFAFVSQKKPEELDQYRTMPIGRSGMQLYMPRDYLAEGMDIPALLSNLEEKPYLSIPETEQALQQRIQEACRSHGFFPRSTIVYNHTESLLKAVNCGLGYTILPEGYLSHQCYPNIVTATISSGEAYSKLLCWKEPASRQAVALFRDMLLDRYQGSNHRI